MPPIHFLKINFHIIQPSTPGSSKWSLSVKFPHQNPACTSPLPCTCYVPRPLILLHLITQIMFGEEYRSLSYLLCSFPHSLVTSSLLGPNIILSTLFSNTLSLLSYLKIVPFRLVINKLLLVETESLNYIEQFSFCRDIRNFLVYFPFPGDTRWHFWLRHYTTNRKVAVSPRGRSLKTEVGAWWRKRGLDTLYFPVSRIGGRVPRQRSRGDS